MNLITSKLDPRKVNYVKKLKSSADALSCLFYYSKRLHQPSWPLRAHQFYLHPCFFLTGVTLHPRAENVIMEKVIITSSWDNSVSRKDWKWVFLCLNEMLYIRRKIILVAPSCESYSNTLNVYLKSCLPADLCLFLTLEWLHWEFSLNGISNKMCKKRCVCVWACLHSWMC